MRKFHVQSISIASIALTVILGIACIVIFSQGRMQFEALQQATDLYITCENDARELQESSNYLTEQARLAAMTGNSTYVDNYFEEVDKNQRREVALAELEERLSNNEASQLLQSAMDQSVQLMQTELYAMRLVREADGSNPSTWRQELQNVQLTSEDAALSNEGKLKLAQDLVSNRAYEDARSSIASKTEQCTSEIAETTHNSQGRASTIFSDIYRKLEVSVAIFAALTLAMCILVRRTIVTPLLDFSTHIENNSKLPVRGAGELQKLAETYNRVLEENEATQMLIRHQAEHDALTDLLNRGSYDKMLALYEEGNQPFALILVDVDNFKPVNDTYGHTTGDKVLRRVAMVLQTTFRSIDHACRIGGDEFAIIMVEMTPDLRYTIEEKIEHANEQLSHPVDGLPSITLSVGVAFATCEDPDKGIFNKADAALYRTKENGRNGYTFYEDL